MCTMRKQVIKTSKYIGVHNDMYVMTMCVHYVCCDGGADTARLQLTPVYFLWLCCFPVNKLVCGMAVVLIKKHTFVNHLSCHFEICSSSHS